MFDNQLRWAIEDYLTSGASVLMNFATTDSNDIVDMSAHLKTIQPVCDSFLEEFRKVSAEKFAPKKLNKRLKDVVDEYHSSSDFLNQVKRGMTRDDYIGNYAKSLALAGDISLDNLEGHEVIRLNYYY